MTRADDWDDALYDAAVAYTNGDYTTAFNLFKPLAEQGNADAQFRLGFMYHTGEGVLQDYREAMKWYRLAAEQGHAGAQHNLGVMYHNGEGVKKDNKKAHMWYNIARANGDDQAGDNIKRLTEGIYPSMTQADISKAQDMARQCLASNYI